MSRQIEFTDLKIENINLRCPWRREKRKSKSIKISLFLSLKPLRKRDTRLLLSFNIEKLESRILESSTRDLFKETNLALEIKMQLVSILKHTTSSRLLKKRKSFKDMVMNLMVNLENVKKKSKLWLTLSIILR